jgi:hypothetical protein
VSTQIDQVLDWRGHTVVDQGGEKIGTFEEVYLDEGTNEPTWAAVKTGTFGLRRTRVVPISVAHFDGNNIRVPFTKEQVKTAPTIDSEGWVPERDQAAILRHYGVSGGESAPSTDRRPEAAAEKSLPPRSPGPHESPGADGSAAPEGDREPARVRLQRYTVTETVTRRSEFGAD